MTASTASLSLGTATGTLAGLGLSPAGANAGTDATSARGQADAASSGQDDSFRKLLGQGSPAQNRSDAQAKDKAAKQASDAGTAAARTDDKSQNPEPAVEAATEASAAAAKSGTNGDDKRTAEKPAASDDADASEASPAIWVAGLPLPGLAATLPLGGAIQPPATGAATGLPAGLTLPGLPGTTLPGEAIQMPLPSPAASQPATGFPTLAGQLDGSSGSAANTTADMTQMIAPATATAALAQTAARQPPSGLPAEAGTLVADKAATAALAAVAPVLVQPLQATEAGKPVDGLDLAALGLVGAGANPPAQATLQAATALFPPTLPAADLDAANFDEAIGARLNWMADQKIGHAHIRVSPEGMGQIEVQMKLDGNRVHAEFSAAQPEVRHALESSLPRLREMLDQQGFQLAQANVGQGQRQFSDADRPAAEPAGQEGGAARADGAAGTATLALPAHGLGLLDAYA